MNYKHIHYPTTAHMAFQNGPHSFSSNFGCAHPANAPLVYLRSVALSFLADKEYSTAQLLPTCLSNLAAVNFSGIAVGLSPMDIVIGKFACCVYRSPPFMDKVMCKKLRYLPGRATLGVKVSCEIRHAAERALKVDLQSCECARLAW